MQQNQTYRIAEVTVDQLLTESSTTLQNITGLAPNLDASKTYKYVLTLLVTGFADSSIKVAVKGPTSNTSNTYGLSSVTPKSTTDGTGIAVTLVDSTLSVIEIVGTIVNGVNSGVLQIQAAQNVSEADQLTIKAGSMLEIWNAVATST